MYGRKKGLQSKNQLSEIKPLSSSARVQLSVRKDTKPSVTGESAPFYGLNMHRGYIKLWRKLEDSAVFRDSYAFHIFTYLLTQAQYQSEKYSCSFEGKQVYLQRGECIIGITKLSKHLKIPKTSAYDALQRLSGKYGIITLKPDNKATIVTLLNWDTYQNDNNKPELNPNSTRTQPDTNQEGKKVKNEKNIVIADNKPTLEICKTYFQELNYPLEAEKFFDYFCSNGWKVSGRAPMKDWKAAARNWCRNSTKFKTNKNYMTKPQESTITKIKEFLHEPRNNEQGTRPSVKGISFQGI